MKKVVDFANKILLITNLWVILYTFIIDYLNYKFPPTIQGTYYRLEGIFPEPNEIPIYLGLTILFISSIIFFYNKINDIYEVLTATNVRKYGLFLFLLVLFITKLGSFPLAGDLTPYSASHDQSFYIIIWLLFVSCIAFLSLELVFIKKFLKNIAKQDFLIYLLVVIFIAFVTFQARFPITTINYAQFYGPVSEVASGKTIFTDIPSRYGFVSILFLALLQKLQIFHVLQLSQLIWIMNIVEYFIFFYLLYKISRSIGFAFIGLTSLLTFDYFSYIQSPQSGPMRWLPPILALLLVYRWKKIDSFRFIVSIAFLSLWTIDSGISLLFGYIATLLIFASKKWIKLAEVVKSLAVLFLSLCGIMLVLDVIHLILGMKLINVLEIFRSLRAFAISGNSMVPIDFHNYFWIVILLYFASIIYFFKQSTNLTRGARGRDPDPTSSFGLRGASNAGGLTIRNFSEGGEGIFRQNLNNILLLFSANLMFFASTYFVGRSAPDYLFKISIFPLITFLILVGIRYRQMQSFKMRLPILIALFFVLVAFPSFARKEYLSESIMKNISLFQKGSIFKPEIQSIAQNKYSDEIEFINKKLKAQEIVIVSSDDTFLFLLSQKKNLLYFNPQNDLIVSKDDMNFAVKKLEKNCPQALAVDCTLVNRCKPHELLVSGWQPFESTLFEEIQTLCKSAYQSTICTNQLCIAEKQKK